MEELKSFLNKLSEALDEAPRTGANKDEPEGMQYILISDTLAKDISFRLKEFAGLLEMDEDDGR